MNDFQVNGDGMISWAELGLLKELLEPTAGLEQRARTIFKLCDADASADIQEEELVRKLKQCNSMAVAVAKALVQSWAPAKPAKKNEQDLTPLHGSTHMRPVHSKRSTILYPRACTCRSHRLAWVWISSRSCRETIQVHLSAASVCDTLYYPELQTVLTMCVPSTGPSITVFFRFRFQRCTFPSQ